MVRFRKWLSRVWNKALFAVGIKKHKLPPKRQLYRHEIVSAVKRVARLYEKIAQVKERPTLPEETRADMIRGYEHEMKKLVEFLKYNGVDLPAEKEGRIKVAQGFKQAPRQTGRLRRP